MAKTDLVLSHRENPLNSRRWLKGLWCYARTAKWNVEMDVCTFGLHQERREHKTNIKQPCRGESKTGTL